MQQTIDENKYLLQQKGNSQSEAAKKLEDLGLNLAGKQRELQEKSDEIQHLHEQLTDADHRYRTLDQKYGQQGLKLREFETKVATMKQAADFGDSEQGKLKLQMADRESQLQ